MTEKFELDSQQLGALPVINAFFDRLGLAGLLETFLPADDARLKLAPAAAIKVVVTTWRSAAGRSMRWVSGPRLTTRRWSDSHLARWSCSTTTGWVGCWPGCSTPTADRC